MTSKECVRRTIARETAPYVPLGFYIVDYDTIEAVIGRKTYVRNKIACQVAYWEGRRDEVVESFKKDTVEFYKKIDCCDLLTFKEAPIVPPKDYQPPKVRKVDPDTWEGEDGSVWQKSDLTNDITCVKRPEPEPPTLDDYTGPVEEPAPDPSVFEACDYVLEHFQKDRYIAGVSGGFTALSHVPDGANGLLSYYTMPEIVHAQLAQSVKRQHLRDHWYVRPGVDGVLFEQDMAASKGPMISPETFAEFCFEPMRRRVQDVRALDKQVLMHNCGNNRTLMEYFIAAGIQCYQSIQTIPDMSLDGLKRDFGDRIALWGGLSIETLITGTPDDCRAMVRRALEAAAHGGGFILGPSHSIAKGTSYENFMAVLDEYTRLRDRF